MRGSALWPCSLFVAVSAAGFVECSLRVLECLLRYHESSNGSIASLASIEVTLTVTLTAALIKQRLLTAAEATPSLLLTCGYSCAHRIRAGRHTLCLTLLSL